MAPVITRVSLLIVTTTTPMTAIGPYRVTRPLESSVHGERMLALHTAHNTSHLLHMPTHTAGSDPRRFAAAVARVEQLDESHVLRFDSSGWEPGIGPWVITDYTGDADGIVTLDRLLALKGGSLTLEESKRAMEQLLSATVAAHAMNLCHGPLEMHEVHVDRRGSLLIEFYGLRQALAPADHATSERDEVRSIVSIGYRLVTGLLPIEPRIPVQHMIEGVDASWRSLFETGLGPVGFASAAHALSAARACRIAGDGAVASVRSLILGRRKKR